MWYLFTSFTSTLFTFFLTIPFLYEFQSYHDRDGTHKNLPVVIFYMNEKTTDLTQRKLSCDVSIYIFGSIISPKCFSAGRVKSHNTLFLSYPVRFCLVVEVRDRETERLDNKWVNRGEEISGKSEGRGTKEEGVIRLDTCNSGILFFCL